MYKKNLIGLALLGACSSAYADVTLNVPSKAQVMVINEEHSGYSMLGLSNESEFVMPDGQNQILFRVAQIVREDGSDKTKYKSIPILVSFEAENANIEMQIPRIDTVDQSRDYEKNPTLKLISGGKEIDFKLDTLSTGFNLMPDYVREVQDYNRQKGIASVDFGYVVDTRYDKQASAQVKSEPKQTAAPVVKADTQGVDTEAMLKFWFAQADSETKKDFVSWAVQNLQ